ncbi:MAG: hypothetical protein ACLFTA_02115 [Candidatus Nanohaloarchaea archaeon]
MDEDQEKRLDDILEEIDKDIEMPPYNNSSSRESFSRRYQQYKKEEAEARKRTSYEKFCYQMSSLLSLKAGESTKQKLNPAINLLGWEITPGMVLSATAGAFIAGFIGWISLFVMNLSLGSALGSSGGIIPTSLMLILVSVPVAAGLYTFYKPVYAAKNKVIKSSGEMILSILYMVVYMRSSPNLEGAVRFAALNLEGPIAKDLKEVLWSLEVGEYKRIDDALENYTERWKNYNKDFLESLNLLRAATNQPDTDRQERLLQDAIDNILDGTQEKMKHYAQSLETPVMILNAVGALLPVLGMIMLPLISAFLGGVITPLHLFILFNLMLPAFLWWFMQRTLSSRPPTVSTKPADTESLPDRWKFSLTLMDKKFRLPSWPVGLAVFSVLALPGIIGYISFPHFYPMAGEELAASAPYVFTEGESLAPLPMLMRSLLIVLGTGFGIGATLILGNFERLKTEEKLKEIESEFPTALFELGNKISGGTPIELSLKEATESTQDLEISELFELSSRNIEEMGMTFEDAIFDPDYGALREFPSQMIHTVMKAVLESSEKGTEMAATAMMTISRYLKNIHKTQEQLNDLMEDTTTTIQMLAYMLAPIVSGVAVGMSQTIISGLFELSQSFQESQSQLPSGAESSAGLDGSIIGNLGNAIPPELLQLVVGIYLIQLLYILGTFYMKITRGDDQTFKYMFTGKILLSGMFFYAITVLIISMLFGGIVTGVGEGI